MIKALKMFITLSLIIPLIDDWNICFYKCQLMCHYSFVWNKAWFVRVHMSSIKKPEITVKGLFAINANQYMEGRASASLTLSHKMVYQEAVSNQNRCPIASAALFFISNTSSLSCSFLVYLYYKVSPCEWLKGN